MIGRERELEALEAFYDNKDTNLLTVLGRSGMGKTCLLKEFVKNRQCIYYTAYSTTDMHQKALFAKAVGLKDTDDETDIPDLTTILDKVTELSEEGTAILILDHYCDFARTDDSYPKILHEYMSEKWTQGHVKLIVCDSSYLQMEKMFNGPRSVWKDLNPVTVELGQMTFSDSAKFLEGVDPVTMSEVYGITGGIPVLLQTAGEILRNSTGEEAVWQIIEKIFLNKFYGFKGTAEYILEKELREKAYYDRLLYSLSNGCQRVNQLSDKLGKPKDVVVPYLTTLMKLGLVKKENPVTEPTNRRKTRYSIISDHDRFWYQIVVSRYDELCTGDTESIRKYWEENRDNFMKPVFTRICREYLLRRSSEKELPFVISNVGNWWENDEETGRSVDFDLMATGETEGRSAYAFGRCFFQNKPVDMLDVKELIDLTKKIHNKVSTFYLFFSVSGFAENVRTVSQTIRNIMLIDLKDMI